MLTRRYFLRGFGGLALGTTALGSYAFAVEPGLMLGVTRYNIAPATWPADLMLKIAVVADIHACEPWMPASRVREIAEAGEGRCVGLAARARAILVPERAGRCSADARRPGPWRPGKLADRRADYRRRALGAEARLGALERGPAPHRGVGGARHVDRA